MGDEMGMCGSRWIRLPQDRLPGPIWSLSRVGLNFRMSSQKVRTRWVFDREAIQTCLRSLFALRNPIKFSSLACHDPITVADDRRLVLGYERYTEDRYCPGAALKQ